MVVAALVLLAGGAGYAIWGRRPAPAPEAAPPVAAVNRGESELLVESHGLARREGGALQLFQKSGEVMVLTDRLQCGDMACPKSLSSSYRYLGWDEKIGGYKLAVTMAASQTMVLTYGEDDPVLVDARHAAEATSPLPMPDVTPPAVKTDDSLAEWLADLTNERDQTEKPLIAAHKDVVSRDGATLSLAYGDRRHLQLIDDLVCGQLACPPQISRSYDYVGESPDGQFHIVHEEGNETEEGLLIDRAGNVLALISVPSFSPDGKFAATAIGDLEASAPHRLEVWDLQGGKANLVFSVPAREDDDTVYEMVGWVDATHLRLKRGSWGGDQRSPIMLLRDTAGWHIEEG